MKAEFTAVVSHELRTPLTSIRGSLGLILGAMAGSLPQKVRDLLEIAQSNPTAWCCSSTISSTSKNSAPDRCASTSQPCPLGDVVLARRSNRTKVMRASTMSASRFAAPSIRHSRCDVDPDRFVSGADQPVVESPWRHLPASGTVTSSRLNETGDAVRVSVRDTGPGIPENFRARIFERFSQADARRHASKGTADSVYISRAGSSRQMQGRIRLRFRKLARARPSGWNCRLAPRSV